MTKATKAAAAEGDQKPRQEDKKEHEPKKSPVHAYPMPGVMDFLGAHVGGELAEEIWCAQR